ncbi:Adenylosuccinate lyase [Buchnera aphidicola (Pterocallis alni)]|uniref:adenylosuccinate lyase n=1 Tax=Buchnera aphidicola TaxID=9 RepID=UPI0034646D02
MNYSDLLAISPIDGRYKQKTFMLKNIFSEYAFFKFRITIEIAWLQKLSLTSHITELPAFNAKINNMLNNIIKNLNYHDIKQIKLIEKKTNHDVKSIEYFLQKKIYVNLFNSHIINFIHFACTSEDINNLAYAYMVKKTRCKILIPLWKQMTLKIKNISHLLKNINMLSRTHGQPATPTTMGKEMINFYYRLNRQLIQLQYISILGKINGATGNYNAHYASYPTINWNKISQEFILSFGIQWNAYTTQIEPHDYLSELFSCIFRFNIILINFSQDIWNYIALNYFKQKKINQEVGSSTMPHKINPINFENAEGNLGLSNAIIYYMNTKLPISRYQRDLSDSTVLRNIGVVISYAVIAYQSILSGIKKISINIKYMILDLNKQWQLLAEPIQTIMRKYNISNAYEQLKLITRGKNVNIQNIHHYIDSLNIPLYEKKKLKKITPTNYLGYSQYIIKNLCN